MTTQTTGRRALTPRLPHAGEIRLGEKKVSRGGKTYPARLDRFRLTGPEHAIRSVADVYGGDPRPWDDPDHPGQWEVYSQTDTLHVAVPVDTPDALDAGCYELWARGGRVRRCDGQTCTLYRAEGEGDKARIVTSEAPCMCDPDAPPDTICKPTTRLRVILPLIPGIGTWRLSTGSVYAAAELAGSLLVLREGGARGLVPAYLRIAQREQKRHGLPTRRFPVPVLEPVVQSAALLAADAFTDTRWQQHRPQLAAPDRERDLVAIEALTGAGHVDEEKVIAERFRELERWEPDFAELTRKLSGIGLTGNTDLLDDGNYARALAAVRPQPEHRNPDGHDDGPLDDDGQQTLEDA